MQKFWADSGYVGKSNNKKEIVTMETDDSFLSFGDVINSSLNGFLQQNNLTHKKDKSATNQPFSKGQMQNCFGAFKNFIDKKEWEWGP